MKKSALGTKVKKHMGHTSSHKLHLHLLVGLDNCILNDTPDPQEPWRRTLLKNGESACIQNEWRICVVIWRRVLSLVCSRGGCTWLSTFNLQCINANEPQIHQRVCLGAKRHITSSSPNCLEACNGLTLLFLSLSSFSFYSCDGPQWSLPSQKTWFVWAG